MTYGESVAHLTRRLTASGRPEQDSRRDVVLLARWRLGWTAAEWLAREIDAAPEDFEARVAPLVERRAGNEPIAYIIGEREFYGRTFRVTPDVLIPRPETELVVEEALACLGLERSRAGQPDAPTLVDVGTGSGCLAITLALERPQARVIAIDTSHAAIIVARENARRLGAGRIEFRHGSLLADVSEPLALVVSNPPYVAEAQRASLPAEVAEHEPPGALFGGADGLDVIRALVPAAAVALAPGGWLVMEVGFGQATAVRRLLETAGAWTAIRFRADLQGIPRVAIAQRSESRR